MARAWHPGHWWSALWPAPCPGCGDDVTTGFCGGCVATIRSGAMASGLVAGHRILSAGSWEGPLRRGILAFKQKARPDLAEVLASLWPDHPPSPSIRLLVPIPTDARRIRSRGYDHARLLAEALGRRWGLPVAHPRTLRRVLSTPRLHVHGPDARRTLLAGAFRVDGRLPSGLMLVDDVWTSGATLEASLDALRTAGGRVCGGVVLARAVGPMRYHGPNS